MVPVLILTCWFCFALATMVKLASMGGSLAEMEKAEQARQAKAQAPRLANAKPLGSAE
jgi:hypothetical protein